jgi:hypothetical protein
MTFTLNRRSVLVLLPFLVMAAAACGATTNAYLTSGTSLAAYQTYAWGPAGTLSTGDARLDNNEIFDARVRARIDAELGRRGLEVVAGPAQPDLLVHYHASVSQKVDVRDGAPASTQYDAHDAAPMVYDAGTLVVDLVEARGHQLLWRGWAEGGLDGVIDNQAWMEERVDQVVERIFQRLPLRVAR